MCRRCHDRCRPATPYQIDSGDDRILPAVALWRFEHNAPVRAVLHRLKYGNCPWIGYSLGKLVGSVLPQPIGCAWDVVVPVPLYPLRLLERGYNQSDWIAHGIGEAIGALVDISALRRDRKTVTQTELTRVERRANVASAFSVSARTDVEGLRVIIVDDTLTTGATLGASAQVLIEAGAAVVLPVAVARAPLRLAAEEQPDAGTVIPSQTESIFYGTSTVGYNL